MGRQIKGVIFDIDGVLEFRGQVYSDAIETVNRLRQGGVLLRFLTNSTLKSRASCAARLRSHGFAVSDEEVFTASYLTAQYLRGVQPRSCWIMVDRDGRDEFRDFSVDEEHPEYVVIGDSRSAFDFDHLNRALRMLLSGSKLIGMQSELLDTSMGSAELNVGSWVGMLERAAGVQAVYLGKPGAFAFETVLGTMGLPAAEVAVVGDRAQTDVVGAQRLGMFSVLVRGGEFREADLEPGIRPDRIIDRVAEVISVLPGLPRERAAGKASR